MKLGPVGRWPLRSLAVCATTAGLIWLGSASISRSDDEAPAGDKQGEAKPSSTKVVARSTIAKPEFLDTMIQEAWEGAGIKPSPMCTDEEFLRRAYLD